MMFQKKRSALSSLHHLQIQLLVLDKLLDKARSSYNISQVHQLKNDKSLTEFKIKTLENFIYPDVIA